LYAVLEEEVAKIVNTIAGKRREILSQCGAERVQQDKIYTVKLPDVIILATAHRQYPTRHTLSGESLYPIMLNT
jgi:hypothetical protein